MAAENHNVELAEPIKYEGNDGTSAHDDGVTYSWRDIEVYAPHNKSIFCRSKENTIEKHILKGISGVCKPGCLLAIMGASGSGKTTLLNVLNGRNCEKLIITGQLMVNDVPLTQDFLSHHSAYVQQQDLFIGTLTVREQLVFQATLRMDQDIPYKKRMERVDQVLLELGLAKCADTFIGIPGRTKGISGGETKRLAFACEVLSNPLLMFCDEPTSGLDSFMALNVVTVLKTMAHQGKSIITTIHQPSSEVFAMFDQILLMSEGHVAFLGNTEDALNLFKNLNTPCPTHFNPADFFIMKLSIHHENEEETRKFCKMVCDKFAESEEYKAISCKMNAPVKNNAAEITGKVKYKASWLTQFSAVCKRSLLEVIRDPLTLKLRLIDAVVMSIIVGLIYLGQGKDINQDGILNINGAMSLIIINMSFGNIFSVVQTFCGQNIIFLREHFNGSYRIDVYYISKILTHLPVSILIPLIYTVIVFFMVGFNPKTGFTTTILIILIVNTAVSYGYMISCLVSSPHKASVITGPLVVPLLIFGGFFLKTTTVPVYFSWLNALSWFSHANEALMINQWASIEEIQCSSNLTTCIDNGKEVLDYLGYEEDNFWNAIINLIILLLTYRIAGFLALLFRTYNRR